MRERRVAFTPVFKRLAECEIEMEAVFIGDIAAGKLRLHGRDIGIVEPYRLEVGKAPPCLAEFRREFDRLAVSGDAVGLPPDRLEHVAEAHPHLGLAWYVAQHLFVKLDRLVEAADPPQRRSLEVGVAGIVGFLLKHAGELVDRLGRPVLPIQHDGEIGAGGGEVGR